MTTDVGRLCDARMDYSAACGGVIVDGAKGCHAILQHGLGHVFDLGSLPDLQTLVLTPTLHSDDDQRDIIVKWSRS